MRYQMMIAMALLVITASAQTRRMANPQNGKTFTVQTQNETILPLLQEAERQFKIFNYEGTFFALENAVAQNANSAEALIMRAKFKKMVGREAEANLDYQHANRLNPHVANLYGYYGNGGLLKILSVQPEVSVQGLTTFQKLKYYYETLDRKTMENVKADQEIELLEKVITDIEADSWSVALSDIEVVLQNFPKSAIAYDLKGVILSHQNDFVGAEKAYLEAVKLDPEFAIAWYNLGRLERRLGNYKKAKNYLDKAIKLQEGLTKAYFERALTLKAMGDSQGALVDYDQVIDRKGESSNEAFVNRGLTKKMLGDYNGALSDLNQVLAEFPDNPELWKNRGNLYLLFGLPNKAIDDYTEAINLDNDYAEAYYNRALVHFQRFDKVSGCADLEKSASLGFEKAKEIQQYFCTY